MVANTIKYELKALLRVLVWVALVCFVMACIGRIFLAGDAENVTGLTFSLIAIYLSLLLIFSAYCVSVGQFSRSLFTGEGYLTFSIPITPTKLLLSKMISAIVAMLACIAVAVVSSAIVFTGMPQVWSQISTWLGQLGTTLNAYFSSDPMLAVELVLIVLAGVPMYLLLFYLVVSVGQLFTKSRKLITILIGLGFFLIVLPILTALCFQPILNAAARVSPHFADWINIVFCVGVDFGTFFLIRYILMNKVNLLV